MSASVYPFRRVRDLPLEEREAFERELNHQTRPMVSGIPLEDQDFFYEGDYERWKESPAVRRATWD